MTLLSIGLKHYAGDEFAALALIIGAILILYGHFPHWFRVAFWSTDKIAVSWMCALVAGTSLAIYSAALFVNPLPVNPRTIAASAVLRIPELRNYVSRLTNGFTAPGLSKGLADKPIEAAINGEPPRPQPYPWMSTATWYPDSRGDIEAVGISIIVEDYPVRHPIRNAVLSILPLEHFHASVSVLGLIDLASGGGVYCNIAEFRPEIWNADDGTYKPLGVVYLKYDTTILTMRATAKNGVWISYAILHKNGKRVDSEQSLAGTFIPDSPIRVREENISGVSSFKDHAKQIEITNRILIKSGAPKLLGPIDAATWQPVCQQLVRHP